MIIQIDPLLLKSKGGSHGRPWLLYEKKNLNLHRGVMQWHLDAKVTSINELAQEIREGIKLEFRPNWLRGFGFGTILHLPNVPADFRDISHHINTRNKVAGVWQWVIICFDRQKVALAVHTWLEGYLRPVYDASLRQLEEAGYACAATDSDKDQLIAELERFHRVLSYAHPGHALFRLLFQ